MAPERRPTLARKRLGQHYLVDDLVIEQIIALIAPRADDGIVEIGPGRGALTAALVASGARVEAIEIDRELHAALQSDFARAENLHIHLADALKFEFDLLAASKPTWKVVGNLPYNISSPLLMRLLMQPAWIAGMIFMLQKEVVERLVAAPGSRTYGRLSVMVQRVCHVHSHFVVAPTSFVPAPKVDSCVVELIPSPTVLAAGVEKIFADVVRCAFGQRRKKLRNALAGVASNGAMRQAGIDPGARAEDVSVEEYVALARTLADERAR